MRNKTGLAGSIETMTDTERHSSELPEPEEPAQSPVTPVPADERAAEQVRSEEGWWARLTSSLTLKKNGNLRENLESVLARDEGIDATFSPEERILLGNILRLREVRIEDVMIPRADVDAVEETVALSTLMEAFHESGHSRMPVYRETLDDPRGMVHIKDLLAFFSQALIGTPSLDEAGDAGAKDRDSDKNAGEAEVILKPEIGRAHV